MDEQTFEEKLNDLFCTLNVDHEIAEILGEDNPKVVGVRTFSEAGLLTNNVGLVVRTEDGSEFQLTIVKSR